MENRTEHTTAPKEQDNPSFISKALKVIAFPAAAIAGFWGASVRTHNAAYDIAKRLGALNDILNVTTPKSEEGIQNLIQKKVGTQEFLEHAFKVKGEFQNAGDIRMQEMGLQGTGKLKMLNISNFKNRWNYISRAEHQPTILTGIKVGTITLGAILAVANSQAIIDFFSRHGKTEEHQR